MKIIGTARNFEVVQPDAVGRFFGNNLVLFRLMTDTPTNPVGNLSTSVVPVYLECYVRPPNFDGMKIEVEGDYDSFDRLFRARSIFIPDNSLFVGAAKRLGLFPSILAAIGIVVFQLVLLFLIGSIAASSLEDFQEAVGIASPLILRIGVSVILYIAWALLLGVLGMYLCRTAFPTIYEAFDRLLRRFTENRPSGPL